MNDLNVINRQNAESCQRHIPALQRAGYWVVEERAGLHSIGIHSFRGETTEPGAEAQARAKLAELNVSGSSTHGILHEPIVDAAPSSSEPLAA